MTFRVCLIGAMLLAWLVAGGCTDGFPDEEAHLGLEDKVRPYGITLDPPEVGPGDVAAITLEYHAPHPTNVAAEWRVALDYDSGLYGTDQVERQFVPVTDLDPPVADGLGFVIQTARFTVPDSVLYWSSALPDPLNDDLMLAILEQLPAVPTSDPPRKAEVLGYLENLTLDDLAHMDLVTVAMVQHLADLVACAVRFRVTLEDGMQVDVTRRLTVRYSTRVASPNVNANADITRFVVGEIPRDDFDLGDLEDVTAEVIWHEFDGVADDGTPLATVPFFGDHTYFTRVRFAPEAYTSPFDMERVLEERAQYHWYYYRVDAPRSGHQFFVTDTGDGAEWYHLDQDARVDPPSVGSRFRVLSVVRDERGEWARYHASPGASTVVGEVVFVAP